MNKEVEINMKLRLNDRNRNFGEILDSILKVISERDGVDKINEWKIEEVKHE